jgi:hypothetical protein
LLIVSKSAIDLILSISIAGCWLAMISQELTPSCFLNTRTVPLPFSKAGDPTAIAEFSALILNPKASSKVNSVSNCSVKK